MSPSSTDKLRDLRLDLAETCLETDFERLVAMCTDPAGDAIATMIAAGVRDLPLVKKERMVAERCHRLLSVESDLIRRIAAFLGLSLFSPPHHLERPFDLIEIDTELLPTVIRCLLSMPFSYQEVADRRRAVAHLEATTKEIAKAVRVIDDPGFRLSLLRGFMESFSAAPLYGEDAAFVTLATDRAFLIRSYLELNELVTPVAMQQQTRDDGRLHLGILCPGILSEVAALRAHISGLDRSKFFITAFIPDIAPEGLGQAFVEHCDTVTRLPIQDIRQLGSELAAAGPDILLCGANITDACTFPWAMVMAQRFAPLQAVMHACPMTTGMDTVDVFVNGTANETPEAPQHHTEKVMLIEGFAGHYDFPGPLPTPSQFTRVQAGLPDAAVVLACGAKASKLSPDCLTAWADIMTQAPETHLVLYPFSPSQPLVFPQKDGLLRWLETTFTARGIDPSRLHVIEAQTDRSGVLGLLQLADIYVDSFPYCGSVSLLDPLQAGLPPVVLEGRTARSRQAAAMLRDTGLDVLVTRTSEDYVSVTLRLIQDATLRREMANAVSDLAATARLSDGSGFSALLGPALIDAYHKAARINLS